MASKLQLVALFSGAALFIGGVDELQARPAGGLGGVGRGGGYRPSGHPATFRSPMPRTPAYNPAGSRPISRPVVNVPVNRPVNNLPINSVNRINPNRINPNRINPNRINPNHPPGWDWWRIYPWSPYNAWRNPYWYPPYNWYYPTWYYPYSIVDSYAYPAYGTGYATAYGNTTDPAAYYGVQGSTTQSQMTQARPEAPLPSPTGELKVPPANGAIIQLRGLDGFTPVRFNGQEVASVGSTRYYVLELAPGKSFNYTIAAVADHNGKPRTEDRRITITAGDNIMIDFGAANIAAK